MRLQGVSRRLRAGARQIGRGKVVSAARFSLAPPLSLVPPRLPLTAMHEQLWVNWRTTLLLGVPAACYAVQNNLIFFSLSNLSAAAAQVIYQLKTLSTAFFTMTILGKSFRAAQWVSFLLLPAGVVLVRAGTYEFDKRPARHSERNGDGAVSGCCWRSWWRWRWRWRWRC